MTTVDLDRGRWAPATREAYANNWSDFFGYCESVSASALPANPQTIADFITLRGETHSPSAVSQRLAAIRAIHKDAKGKLPKLDPQRELYTLDDPVIADAWADIRRSKGLAKTPKAALALDDIKRIVRGIPPDNYLHRAVMLVGFASAMRRSELAALNREDVAISPEGMTITIRRSKTDKSGKGETIAIVRSDTEFCPVAALERWVIQADLIEGALFRNSRGHRIAARDIADAVVKRWAAAAGYDPKQVAAHSLRRGCITTMFNNDSDIKSIMVHSRHKTVDIAMGYVEAKRAMMNPAVKMLGL